MGFTCHFKVRRASSAGKETSDALFGIEGRADALLPVKETLSLHPPPIDREFLCPGHVIVRV